MDEGEGMGEGMGAHGCFPLLTQQRQPTRTHAACHCNGLILIRHYDKEKKCHLVRKVWI